MRATSVASRFGGFLGELKRRKVYHVGAAYLAVGVAIAIAVPDLFGAFRTPPWAAPLVIVLIVLGFPIALVLAWAYEVRPEEPARDDAAAAATPAASNASAHSTAAAGIRKSIVVLPFDNLSPDPGDAYFADGLTEEVITDLSCCGLLRVISRNSAMALKDTRMGTRAIAEELEVQYVLEGSVRKAGDDLLVTAQLIDAAADEHLWAERFNGTLDDVFEIQGRLSRSIVDALRLKLTAQEEKALAARPIGDPRAYEVYLLAMHEHSGFTAEGLRRAVRRTKEAINLLGENALLSATLAQLYYAAYDIGIWHDHETLAEMERWSETAIRLDPDLGHAYWALALVRFKKGDMPGYVRYGREAVERSRDPYHSGHLGVILSFLGKVEEARRLAAYAIDRDPLSFFSYLCMACVEIFSGHPALGLQIIGDARAKLADDEPFGLWWEAQAAGFAGDDDRAARTFERVAGMEAGALSNLSEFLCRALHDDVEGMREVLRRPDMLDMGNSDEWFPVYFANAFALVSEIDEAIRWLDQAVTWGFSNHEFLTRHDRYLEPLWGNPRFEAVVQRAREKERALEA